MAGRGSRTWYHDLSVWQLAMALVLVAAIIVVSVRQSLGLERDLAVGTVRAIVQLMPLVSSSQRCSQPRAGTGLS